MPSDGRGPLRICSAAPARRADALALVFRDLAPEARRDQVHAYLHTLAGEPASGHGLWTAEREVGLVGALFAQIQPGRAALIWPPRLVVGEPSRTAVRLLKAACDWLRDEGVAFAQAMLPLDAFADALALQTGGFRYLAHLLYLVATRDVFPHAPPESDLLFEAYAPSDHERFVAVLESTYEQSLDCPVLDEMRTTEDTLAGYRATGVFDPRRWLIARHQGRDIGCLVLTDHPDHENWELIYLGVAPSARGRGWGRRIARHAQWLACQAGRQRLVLAVDAANTYAIETYKASGFQLWEQRRIYGSLLDASGTSTTSGRLA